MTQPDTIVINESWFVAMVALLFAYLGARRGLGIELYLLGGVIAGMLLAEPLAKFLGPWINTIYQLILAVVRERVYSPEKVLAVLFKQPKLITTDLHREWLGSLLFIVLFSLGLVIGRKRSKSKSRFTTRVLAALVGGVNGYLFAYFWFPRIIKVPRTTIVVPAVPIREFLKVQLGIPIFVVILVAITMGVLGSRQGKAKGK